jgi:hypothetical protein
LLRVEFEDVEPTVIVVAVDDAVGIDEDIA